MSSFARRADDRRSSLTFFLDGEAVEGREGDTVAAAILAATDAPTRFTPVSGAPRQPYCMMGVCFDCLVTIDGAGSRQACLVAVRAGMRIERQLGPRALGPDGPGA